MSRFEVTEKMVDAFLLSGEGIYTDRAIARAALEAAFAAMEAPALPPGVMYYSLNTEYELEQHSTAEEARAAAEAELECDGEWPEGIEYVEWGALVPMQEAKECDRVEPDADSDDERAQMAAANGWSYHCNYKLVDVRQHATAPSARSWKTECKVHREALANIASALGMSVEREGDSLYMPCGSDIVAELKERLAAPSAPSMVPTSFAIGSQQVFFMDGEWRAHDTEAGTGDEGYHAHGSLQHVVDEALEAEVSGRSVDARTAPSAPVWTSADGKELAEEIGIAAWHSHETLAEVLTRVVPGILTKRQPPQLAGQLAETESAKGAANSALGAVPTRDQVEAKLSACRFLNEEIDAVFHFLREGTTREAALRQEIERLKAELSRCNNGFQSEVGAYESLRTRYQAAESERDQLKRELEEARRYGDECARNQIIADECRADAEAERDTALARAEAAEKALRDAEETRSIAVDREQASERKLATLRETAGASASEVRCLMNARSALEKSRCEWSFLGYFDRIQAALSSQPQPETQKPRHAVEESPFEELRRRVDSLESAVRKVAIKALWGKDGMRDVLRTLDGEAEP